MIDELQLFRGQDYKINDYITIHQPTLNEICDMGEQRYFSLVGRLTSTPADYKVQLDDSSVDYETVREVDFFFMICKDISIEESSILLKDLDLTTFLPYTNAQNSEIVYANNNQTIIIDENIHRLITDYIRIIHGMTKNIDRGGNAHTKKYLIDAERRKQKRNINKPYQSMLIPSISAMTNSEGFKYNHDTVWSLHIYTFNDSIKRIQKIKNVDNLYKGIYSGCVDAKKISQEELNWLGSLDK